MQNCINHIVVALYEAGCRDLIVSPGSRSAPISVAVSRFGHFNIKVCADERSAAFVGLGIAMESKKPVGIICTSGSALANYYPAVLEAYYRNVPLIVLSADRPPELIDQWDGQTIHQQEIFGTHQKGFFECSDQYQNPLSYYKLVYKAVQLANSGKKGPVHINIPLRDPLYKELINFPSFPEMGSLVLDFNETDEEIDFSGRPRMISKEETQLFEKIQEQKLIWVLCGLDSPTEIYDELKNLNDSGKLIVISDIISGLHQVQTHKGWENYLMSGKINPEFLPEIIISVGKAQISKNLKLLLRSHQFEHFHISEFGEIADPFFSNPKLIQEKPKLVFNQIIELLDSLPFNEMKLNIQKWKSGCEEYNHFYSHLLESAQWSDFSACLTLKKIIPQGYKLHLGNSMPVRYFSLMGADAELFYFCNRGVSGIDGCLSTAVGAAYASDSKVLLVLGDISFFYDVNGLWQEKLPENLKIVILNNGGGGIFGLIDGPGALPELNRLFASEHQLNSKDIASHFNIPYLVIKNQEELNDRSYDFFNNDGLMIMEILTKKENNSEVFKNIKNKLNAK